MKKLVFTIALAASAMPALSAPVPPFVLRCEAPNGPEFPVAVKWDGNNLAIYRTRDASSPTTLLKKPVSNYFETPIDDRKNGKGPSRLQISFRGEDSIVTKFQRPKEGESLYVSLFMNLDQNRDVDHAWLSHAEIAGDVLMEASQTLLLKCATTLGL